MLGPREPWKRGATAAGPASRIIPSSIARDQADTGQPRSIGARQPGARSVNFDGMANKIDLERADRGGDRRRAGHRPGDRRAAAGFRRRGRDLGPRRARWPNRPRTNSAAAARSRRSPCDVTRLAEIERARDATVKALGRIDILVNNAGIAGPNVTTWEYPIGGLARGDARQSRQPVLLLPRHRAADDRAELRPHRQHRLDRRQGGQPERGRPIRRRRPASSR